MDRLTDDARVAILETAYDNLEPTELEQEVAELDPYRPDALEHWNSLRPKQQKPQPQQSSLTRADRDYQAQWVAFIEQKISEEIAENNKGIGQCIGEYSAKNRKQWRAEIKELRGELRLAQKQIRELQRQNKATPPAMITAWKVDRKKFRIIPFYANGQAGPPIPARVLFEEYNDQVRG